MDGRLFTVLAMMLLPGALIGVTIGLFSSNPIAILCLISVMIIGALYLLTYRETFA
ncbi:MAG TPA: hypothetical protein VML53_01435 [Thermoplasmata archaeon]|nr:hypothetical protein [Thermoplasmata archaeon]